MFGFAWLTLRQAQEALRHGRLDEAQRLLSLPAANGHRRTGPLLVQLAQGFAERGERLLGNDDVEGAWRDLLNAEQQQTANHSADRLRQALTRLGVTELRALFQSGDLRRANEAIARLRGRGVRSAEFQVLEDAVRGWGEARELADRGEFTLAVDAVGRLRRLILGPIQPLEEFAVDLEKRRQAFAGQLGSLHKALEGSHWPEVVQLAEEVLAIAPHHGEARKARARAWKAIEPVTVPFRPVPSNGDGAISAVACDTSAGPPATRYLLWIDGVGGYLICLGGRLTFGQAYLDGHIDVPLIADVSRLHATLTRDSEGYLLEAVRPVQVNGKPTTRALLRPGDRVTLGTSCQFQFQQPAPVSATARLDLVSGHRLPVAVEGILLMADTLVLDSGGHAHVQIPDLKQSVVLFRHREGLGLRHGGRLNINGTKAADRVVLPPGACVSGEDIAFALEPVTATWK
jgi:hypothetical protein